MENLKHLDHLEQKMNSASIDNSSHQGNNLITDHGSNNSIGSPKTKNMNNPIG
jgi:hypothetical protein